MLTIEFYKSKSSRIPVIEFMQGIGVKAQAKIARSLDLLEEFGLNLGEPHIKRVVAEEKLWELRVRLSSNSYRILFFHWRDNRVVLLHGFAKKTDKIARRHINTARERMEDFLRSETK